MFSAYIFCFVEHQHDAAHPKGRTGDRGEVFEDFEALGLLVGIVGRLVLMVDDQIPFPIVSVKRAYRGVLRMCFCGVCTRCQFLVDQRVLP